MWTDPHQGRRSWIFIPGISYSPSYSPSYSSFVSRLSWAFVCLFLVTCVRLDGRNPSIDKLDHIKITIRFLVNLWLTRYARTNKVAVATTAASWAFLADINYSSLSNRHPPPRPAWRNEQGQSNQTWRRKIYHENRFMVHGGGGVGGWESQPE